MSDRLVRILRAHAIDVLDTLVDDDSPIDSVTIHADVIDDIPFIDVEAHRGKERVVSVSEVMLEVCL